MLRKSLLTLLCCLWFVPSCFAEIVYVTDRLYLGLYEQDGGQGAKLGSVVSGTELEILGEPSGAYRHIKTKEGLVGWVKASYLVTDKPATLIVKNAEHDLETLTVLFEDAQQQLADAQLKATRLEVDYNNSREENLVLNDLREENRFFHEKLNQYLGYFHFGWIVFAAVLCLFGGGAAAYWYIDWLARRRHEGHRIY